MTEAEIIEEIKVKASEAKETVKGVKSAGEAIKLLPTVVKSVEELSKEIKQSGLNKRNLVVNVLNSFVDIPFIPESIEAAIFGVAVDAVIAAFNKYFGKQWLEVIIKPV